MNSHNLRNVLRPLSLGQLTIVLLLIFVMPGLVMAAVYQQEDETDTKTEKYFNQRARELDLHIASSIRSPFYLSREDPCALEVQQEESEEEKRIIIIDNQFSFENGIKIVIPPDKSTLGCRWVYDLGVFKREYNDANIIDEWIFVRNTWIISKRTYEWDIELEPAGVLETAVIDHFNPLDSNCFKRREYPQLEPNEDDRNCLPESGIKDGLRSPIPPAFYWFFYR